MLSDAAKEQKRAYMREYRNKNKDRLNEQRREWYSKNRDKAKDKQDSYWERMAARVAEAADGQDET
jgi:hypothetical protein